MKMAPFLSMMVSRTVRDLAAGSDLRFEERGQRLLKGVFEPIQVFEAKKEKPCYYRPIKCLHRPQLGRCPDFVERPLLIEAAAEVEVDKYLLTQGRQ